MSRNSIQEAAWVARCVGRSDTVPFSEQDLSALASYIARHSSEIGGKLFSAGEIPPGVYIIRSGLVELVVGSGPRRLVVGLLNPGEVDGDVQLLLHMPFPYTARAVGSVSYLFIERGAFERLLLEHPTVTRRWLSSVAARVASSQRRIVGLLGRSLSSQVARLLQDEAVDGRILLPQRTIAAMLGVHRPSVNKIIKDLEGRGVIKVGYREIHILNATALARLAS